MTTSHARLSELRRILCVALGTVVVLLSSTPRATAADPLTIDVIASLTGPAAFLGKEATDALRVIEATTNKSGGVAGRSIKFDVHDDGSSAQVAVQLANSVIAKKGAVILGAQQVTACNAIAPLLRNGPFEYCFSPGVQPAAGSYQFSASVATTDYIIASIRYMRENGWKKVALLTSTDASGQDAEASIQAAIDRPENRDGVALIDREHFNITDLSVSAQMARIRNAGAQAAILWTNGTPFGTVLRGAFEAGLDIPIIASAGNLNYAQLSSYRAFMSNNLYIMAPPWAAADRLPEGRVKALVVSYLRAFASYGIRPDQGESLAWDSAALILDAYRHLGANATATQIRDYIANVHEWVGVNGVYDFRKIPQRGVGINWLVMVRWDPASEKLIAVSKPGGYAR